VSKAADQATEHRSIRFVGQEARHMFLWSACRLCGYAKVAGQYLIRAKKRLEHGRFKLFVQQIRPKISHETANLYMRIADRWNKLEHDPEMAIRQANKSLVTRTRTTKLNSDDILRSKAFKAVPGTLWEKWEPEELEYLKSNCGMCSELEATIVKSMKTAHYVVQEALGKKVHADEI
jgi:hypothetical protein